MQAFSWRMMPNGWKPSCAPMMIQYQISFPQVTKHCKAPADVISSSDMAGGGVTQPVQPEKGQGEAYTARLFINFRL